MRKRATTFKALRARFFNLHIRNPHIKSNNLAKTKSLLIFVKEKLASGLMCGTMEEKEKVEEFKSFKEASRSFFFCYKLPLREMQYHWLRFQGERV